MKRYFNIYKPLKSTVCKNCNFSVFLLCTNVNNSIINMNLKKIMFGKIL